MGLDGGACQLSKSIKEAISTPGGVSGTTDVTVISPSCLRALRKYDT